VSESSKLTFRCITPSRPGSECAERIVQSACAVTATARKRSAALTLATVFVQQRLKLRIVSQRVPNWICFQALHRDSARSAKQPVQDFNRATVVAVQGLKTNPIWDPLDRKSTRLHSSHQIIPYA